MVNVITDISIEQFELLLSKAKTEHKGIICKFGASWCAPCRNIKRMWESTIQYLQSNWFIIDLDVDESSELYLRFKRYRRVQGIPAIMVWYPLERDTWYVPDDAILNGIQEDVKEFLDRQSRKQLTDLKA